jgi:hypothetical protein
MQHAETVQEPRDDGAHPNRIPEGFKDGYWQGAEMWNLTENESAGDRGLLYT